MPSDLAYWLVSTPLIDHDPSRTLSDIQPKVQDLVADGSRGLAQLEIPNLKSGTLNSLLTLSETLPKTDGFFTTTVSKLLDTLRSLLGENDIAKLGSHTRVNDRPIEEYLFPRTEGGWKWDKRRWGSEGKVTEVVENLNKELTSIDNIQKTRLQSYNLAKGQLTNLQRKLTGNLSTRSLVEIVKPSDVKTGDSEFLETIFVAVPNNLVKDWHAKYERLAPMVVPRSSSQIAKDDEYTLFSVTVFKKTKDEFLQKSREARFIARDFTYDPEAVEKGRRELESAQREERELYSDLLRLTRTNFSEAFQLLVHLKVARLFVESVLRYGLPAEYAGVIIKPDPKTSTKLHKALTAHYSYLRSKSDPSRAAGSGKKGGAGGNEEAGEWAGVMEEEWEDFVWMEVGKVI